MLMKLNIRVIILFILLALLAGCSKTDLRTIEDDNWSATIQFHKPKFKPADSLEVMTWDDYIPPEVFKKFTEVYGTKLNVTIIQSNEELYSLLKQDPEKYDLIMPGDYLVSKLIKAGMLYKLDLDKIPNSTGLDESIRRLNADLGIKYTIPLFFSSIGIAFNIKYIAGLPRNWDFIMEQARNAYLNYRLFIRKEMRIGMGVALMSQGFSPNSVNPEEIEQAKMVLINLVKHYGLKFVGEATGDALKDSDALLGVVWNGTASYALGFNHNIRFLFPEGSIISTYESGAIPIGSKNKETAELLLNYLITPEVMGRTSNFNYFSNSNPSSMTFVKTLIKNSPGFMMPPEENRVYIQELGDSLKLYEKAWEEIQATKPDADVVFLPLPKNGLFGSANPNIKASKQLSK